MARPVGSKNKPKAPTADGEVASNHNGKPAREPLTDEQEHALCAHHALAYEKALAAKKAADAAFKNTCKLAKSEGVPLASIKDYIELQTEEGQEKLREEIARKHKVARWAGLPVGTQANFFDEEPPSIDRAMDDGKRAGLKGESAKPPDHLTQQQQDAWLEGHAQGQSIIAGRFQKTGDDDGPEYATT